jgi:hypothetical protein
MGRAFNRLFFRRVSDLLEQYPGVTVRDFGQWVEEELEARNLSFIFKPQRGRIVTPMPDASRARTIEIDKRLTALGEADMRTAGLVTETGEPYSEHERLRALRRAYYKIMDDPLPVAVETQTAWAKRAWYARKHGAQAKRKFERWAGELKRWLVIAVVRDESEEVTIVTDASGFKSAYVESPNPEDAVLGSEGDNVEHWLDMLTPAERREIERELNDQPPLNRMTHWRARRKLQLAIEAQREVQKNP